MNTLDQDFAGKVYDIVAGYRQHADRTKYGAMAQKLPILIRSAGLAQALAFVDSKGGINHQLLNDLAQVVAKTDKDDLLRMSRGVDSLQEYVFLTHKVQLALEWFYRFSQSVLDVSPGEGEAR